MHEQTGGGEFGAESHRPSEPILDRDHETGAGADELLGIHMEGTGHRHGHGELAEREHDQIDDERTNAVRQNRTDRACLLNGISGAQEQAGADHAAQRDHLQVAGFHAALQVGMQRVLAFAVMWRLGLADLRWLVHLFRLVLTAIRLNLRFLLRGRRLCRRVGVGLTHVSLFAMRAFHRRRRDGPE